MAEHAADEYHHGQMDVHAQESTFRGFVRLTKWGSLALAVSILSLVLWFATDAGFIGGAIAGVVLLVVGIYFLREKQTAGPTH